jgi:hypothetical protein
MRRGFTIHHNGPPANCIGRGHDRCVAFWDSVRAFHTNPEPIGKGWSDIAYSFGVCPHGERLVGRGWDRRQWANGTDMVGADDGDDSDWYTVLVFVGGDTSTGDTEPPTAEMIGATAQLIEEGRSTGRCGDRVTPHNFWKRKPCPGPEFTVLAREWDGRPTVTEIPLEDDMTPAETEAAVNAALVKAITTPAHPFRVEFARLVDSRLAAMKVATKADADLSPAEIAGLATAVAAEVNAELAEDTTGSGVSDEVVEAALRRVFADAATRTEG